MAPYSVDDAEDRCDVAEHDCGGAVTFEGIS